jgi:HEAT repeat protein
LSEEVYLLKPVFRGRVPTGLGSFVESQQLHPFALARLFEKEKFAVLRDIIQPDDEYHLYDNSTETSYPFCTSPLSAIPEEELTEVKSALSELSVDWKDAKAEEVTYQNKNLNSWVGDLSNPDRSTKNSALEAMLLMGPYARAAADAAVPKLIAIAEDRSQDGEQARRLACMTLGGMGPNAESAVPVLVAILDDENTSVEVRISACSALGGIGLSEKSVVPLLIKALSDHNDKLRYSAANALGRFGPRAKEALPALIKTAHFDVDASPRRVAISAIVDIGNADEVFPVLMELVRQDDVRWSAIHGLERLGPAATKAVPFLDELVANEGTDYHTREIAKKALRLIRGPD